MIYNEEWQIMGNKRQWEYDMNGDERQWKMGDNGGITDNGRWQTIEDDRQLWMTDNGECHTIGNYR